jgi:hypothetical protein
VYVKHKINIWLSIVKYWKYEIDCFWIERNGMENNWNRKQVQFSLLPKIVTCWILVLHPTKYIIIYTPTHIPYLFICIYTHTDPDASLYKRISHLSWYKHSILNSIQFASILLFWVKIEFELKFLYVRWLIDCLVFDYWIVWTNRNRHNCDWNIWVFQFNFQRLSSFWIKSIPCNFFLPTSLTLSFYLLNCIHFGYL